jgi:hypothetical protein
MFFHRMDCRMIPYLGEDFVRALLGLDACDGAAEAQLDLDDAKPLVTPAKMKAQSADTDINPCCFLHSGTFLITPDDSTKRETLTSPLRGRSVVFPLWDRLVHWLNKHSGPGER